MTSILVAESSCYRLQRLIQATRHKRTKVFRAANPRAE
jgi:hypothetical protein